MKKIFLYILLITVLFSGNTFAEYNENLDKDPLFMENVYNFINTSDISENNELNYCEKVYLEATRRREYTEFELLTCWEYFIQKNNEEKAYMQYMFNNRELFY